MKKLVINWNEAYEVDLENPESDIALLVDKKQKRTWIKGVEFRATEKKIRYLSQIIELTYNSNIISLEKLEEVNNLKPELESFQRYFERINKKLKDHKKQPLFLRAPQKYNYYINTDEYFQRSAII